MCIRIIVIKNPTSTDTPNESFGQHDSMERKKGESFDQD